MCGQIRFATKTQLIGSFWHLHYVSTFITFLLSAAWKMTPKDSHLLFQMEIKSHKSDTNHDMPCHAMQALHAFPRGSTRWQPPGPIRWSPHQSRRAVGPAYPIYMGYSRRIPAVKSTNSFSEMSRHDGNGLHKSAQMSFLKRNWTTNYEDKTRMHA